MLKVYWGNNNSSDVDKSHLEGIVLRTKSQQSALKYALFNQLTLLHRYSANKAT